jgi:NTP pyrophosphatase (non-canonical NTP hydrolase)
MVELQKTTWDCDDCASTNPMDCFPRCQWCGMTNQGPTILTINTRPTSDQQLAALSRWIDSHPPNMRSPYTTQLWARCGKIGEEFGEVIEQIIAYTKQNPRKTTEGSRDAIKKEILDVAVTALCAIEFLQNNDGTSLLKLYEHINYLYSRAFKNGELRT